MEISLKRILRDPLVHFLLLGGALFIVYGLVAKPGSDRAANIVITQGQVDNLVSGFSKAWQRPPTADELEGLVRDLVREEVYCREAIALGLDQDDTVIRRRLRQKMEFISEDTTPLTEPSETDLNNFMRAHSQSYRSEARFTFRQVFLNPEIHGDALSRDATRLLTQLNHAGAEADISAVGDTLMLDTDFPAVPVGEIEKQFGPRFVQQLQTLEQGRWQGPIESGYGMHLVLVTERIAARMPELTEVQDDVRRDWETARRLETNEAFYRQLLERYNVTIEGVVRTVPTTIAQRQAR